MFRWSSTNLSPRSCRETEFTGLEIALNELKPGQRPSDCVLKKLKLPLPGPLPITPESFITDAPVNDPTMRLQRRALVQHAVP